MTVSVAYPGCFLLPELDRAPGLDWQPVCHITYTRDTWVKLLQRPSSYADGEAKLLCQQASGHWVAWVPNHGEVVLEKSQFYC